MIKTWFDTDGTVIATASVRRPTQAEAEAHERRWCVGARLRSPYERDKYYTTKHDEVGGGPFDTSAEAMALADKLNGGIRVNGRFVQL